MTSYELLFAIKINAKDKKDLSDKAENIMELLSKSLHKKVESIGYRKLDEPYGQTKLM